MVQETTEEFARRFGAAVEGHPLSPATPHGRQRWVLEKLKNEVGLSVSPNTMSKWFHGTARPRQDNIRKIAQVLSVDEVWLGSGRKPFAPVAEVRAEVTNARGAVLALAGAVEMSGGRVTFPDGGDDPSDLHINFGSSSFSATKAKQERVLVTVNRFATSIDPVQVFVGVGTLDGADGLHCNKDQCR